MQNRSSVDWKGIGAFTVLVIGLGWLVSLPLWVSEQGLASPYALPLLLGLMLTPSLATLIVVRFISRSPEGVRVATGLVLGRGRHWGWYWLIAWLGTLALTLSSPFVAALFGQYPLDLQAFSGFQAMLKAHAAQAGGAAAEQQASIPIQALIGAQLATALIVPIINIPATFGEEWGWRGYLQHQLMPLGTWPALIVTGLIWGLWHAPIILLGYNYPLNPPLGVLMMTGMCMILAVLFGWTRLATGSIWPAVIAHAFLNGSAGVVGLLYREGYTLNSFVVGITGWTGWLLPLLVIVVLALTGRLRNQPGDPGPA
jgi:membrane protease YdiL (CAAX protease family)